MELDKLLLKFVLKKTCKISQKNFGVGGSHEMGLAISDTKP